MASDVEKIKERLGIVDVISSYLKLEKAGKNLKACCPFHNEKTPSFFVSPERDSFYCFGCGVKGDIFSFVESFEGLDFRGALDVLALKAGVNLVKENPKLKNQRERIFSIMEKATSFFEEKLQQSSQSKSYLKKRGLNEETIKLFRLGFIPEEWRLLYNFLKKEGFNDSDIQEAGLVRKNEKGDFYDWFRGRIIFPITDSSGRTIAFSGRLLEAFNNEEKDKSPKYINSPETMIFNKSKVLYGIDKAKIPIRKKDFCILVEGQIDILMAHQIGYRNTVALSGTALSKDHLTIINRLTNKLILAFDADSAGFEATKRGAKIALSLGIDFKIANIPKGSDPADLILDNSDKWRKTIKESKHIIDFGLDNLISRNYDERQLNNEIKRELFPYLIMIENKIDQFYFIKKISEKINIPEKVLIEEIEKIKPNELGKDNELEITTNFKQDRLTGRKSIERKIAGIIFWQESFKKPKIDPKNLRKRLSEITGNVKINDLMTDQEKNEAIFESEVFYNNSGKIMFDLDEMFINLEENYLKDNLTKLMNELSQAEKDKDKEKSLKILKKCQQISEKIHNIKNKR